MTKRVQSSFEPNDFEVLLSTTAGRTMGHAGAIVGGSDDTAQAKKRIMRECGMHVVDSP